MKKKVAITIIDVAKKAGVSPASVSRVMNDGSVKKETKRKVLDAIAKLNYIPNQSARNLGSVNTKKRIAVIIPELNSFISNRLIEGIRDITNLYGFDYALLPYYNDQKLYEKVINETNFSTEYMGIIEIGKRNDFSTKIVVNMYDDLFNISVREIFKDKKATLFFDEHNVFKEYFEVKILEGISIIEYSEEKTDFIVVESIEKASQLIAQRIKKEIFILEDCCYTSELIDQIKQLEIDFYSMGVILARQMIKDILEYKTDKSKKIMKIKSGKITIKV